MFSSGMWAALAGALAGAVFGGIFQDMWAVRRARLRAVAKAATTLRRARAELVRLQVLLELAEREQLADGEGWLAPALPPRVLSEHPNIVEDLPDRLSERIVECDDAVTSAEASLRRMVPAIATAAGQLTIAAGSVQEYATVLRGLQDDLSRAVQVLRVGVEELSHYHSGLSDLHFSGSEYVGH